MAERQEEKPARSQYLRCLRDSAFWHRYSKTECFGADDVAMWACKDHGCALNFYGQIKLKQTGEEWPGSKNSHEEMLMFQKCMANERRLFLQAHPVGTFSDGVKQGGDLTVYSYTKNRLRTIEQKIMTKSSLSYPLLDPEDHIRLREMVLEKKQGREADPLEGDVSADF